jgi:hypothetical protein
MELEIKFLSFFHHFLAQIHEGCIQISTHSKNKAALMRHEVFAAVKT